MAWDLDGQLKSPDAQIEGRKAQGMSKRVRNGFDPVTARALGSIIQFQNWLKNQAWAPQTGWLGETGIANPSTPVSPGYIPIDVESYMGVLSTVTNLCQELGMGVLYWDCTECSVEQNSMYGPDTEGNGGVTGPLRRKHPTSMVMESHITNAGNSFGPFVGIAYKGAHEGQNPTAATQASFSNTRDNRTFDISDAGMAPLTTYNYMRPESLKFLADNNVRFVRVCIRWERLQRSLGGPLDAVELQRIDDMLAAAQANGVYVIIDIHNGGAYFLDDGTKGVRRSLGNGTLTQAHFVNLWTRLASHWATTQNAPDPNNTDVDTNHVGNTYNQLGRNDLRPNIAGYELMNEPMFFTTDGAGNTARTTGPGRTAGTAANTWAEAANAAGQAIRALDSTATLLVHPYGGGGAGSTFFTYHYDGPFMYASGGATGQGNTNFQTHVVYIAHLYYNSAMSGDYTIETFAANYKAREGEGYVPKRRQRTLSHAHVLDGGTYFTRAMITGVQSGSNNLNVPALPASSIKDLYQPAAAPYAGYPGRTLIISNVTAIGASGQLVALYVRPAGFVNAFGAVMGSNVRHINHLRKILTIPAGGSITYNQPIFVGPGDILVAECNAGGAVTLVMTAHEISDLEVGVWASGQMAAATDVQVAAAAAGTITRILGSAGGPPSIWGWAAFNTSGIAWPVFNGGSEGVVAAANSISFQGKLQYAGAGTKYNLGAPVVVASGATGTDAVGQAALYPGVPVAPTDIELAGGDILFLNATNAGANVWALTETRGA